MRQETAAPRGISVRHMTVERKISASLSKPHICALMSRRHTRWYHSHNMAGTDLRRSLYSGMYGFLIVEPASDPGRYDQEVLLATHHWEGSLRRDCNEC
jgi:hypothetical protein